MRRLPVLLLVVTTGLCFATDAAYSDQGRIASAKHQYLRVNGKPYALEVYRRPSTRPAAAPTLVFFHGGAWSRGSSGQFRRQALFLIKRADLVVISVDYPVKRNPVQSTRAAQTAVCWVRRNSQHLGVELDRVALSGGSAGGQLALAAYLADASDVPECQGLERPYAAALILFNPVLRTEGKWERRFHASLGAISPITLLKRPLPPTIIFQGAGDTVAPLAEAQQFVRAAHELGSNQVNLVTFEGRRHGFFNRHEFAATMEATLAFLRQLGWLG
jgi:acetyl esterase